MFSFSLGTYIHTTWVICLTNQTKYRSVHVSYPRDVRTLTFSQAGHPGTDTVTFKTKKPAPPDRRHWSMALSSTTKYIKQTFDIYWILNYCQIIKDITVRALSIILLMEVSDVPNKIQCLIAMFSIKLWINQYMWLISSLL